MTRREMEIAWRKARDERDEILALLTTVLRQTGPFTIKRSVYVDAAQWTLKGEPTGDDETTILKAVKSDGTEDTPLVILH